MQINDTEDGLVVRDPETREDFEKIYSTAKQLNRPVYMVLAENADPSKIANNRTFIEFMKLNTYTRVDPKILQAMDVVSINKLEFRNIIVNFEGFIDSKNDTTRLAEVIQIYLDNPDSPSNCVRAMASGDRSSVIIDYKYKVVDLDKQPNSEGTFIPVRKDLYILLEEIEQEDKYETPDVFFVPLLKGQATKVRTSENAFSVAYVLRTPENLSEEELAKRLRTQFDDCLISEPEVGSNNNHAGKYGNGIFARCEFNKRILFERLVFDGVEWVFGG